MRFLEIELYAFDENGTKNLLADRVAIADTVISRLKGLMFEKELKENHALILYPCNSIHMFFMRFPIDVIYTDENFAVVKTVKNIKPWKVDFGHSKAKYTIELPIGTVNFNPKKIILSKNLLFK